MKTIPVSALDEVHVISDVPLQLIYYRHDIEQRASTLTALPSVEDICQNGPVSDANNSLSVGHYLNTLNKELNPSLCEKSKYCSLVFHCLNVHMC